MSIFVIALPNRYIRIVVYHVELSSDMDIASSPESLQAAKSNLVGRCTD
ncbi:hypothetical protein MY3957_006076 [Beauveria namnaoensis]